LYVIISHFNIYFCIGGIVATIFLCGLIIGTRLFGTPQPNTISSNNEASSPLAAATSKIAPDDIQKLIMESAQAEVEERKEHELEEEAIKHGDNKLAAHLRGALVPGDANYNPHHHVDDVLDDDETKKGVGEGVDGGMYAAGDNNHLDHNKQHNEQHLIDNEAPAGDMEQNDMHNHSLEALKNEYKEVKSEVKHAEEKVVESMHNQFAAAVENERKAVNIVKSEVVTLKDKAKEKLSGLRGNIQHKDEQTSAPKVGHAGEVGGGGQYYPYMTAPVSTDYDFSRYEPLGGNRFTEYKNGDSPYDITTKLIQQSDELARSRRVHVLDAMKHIWKNYKEFAWGKDELHPISKKATANWGGVGTTLVDSLDTLWLMGMKDEFYEARDWVRDNLSHDHVGSVSGFETTIRSLGGLIAAYDLSKDEVFLKKADELGSRLVKAYDTPSGLPHGSINLQTGRSNNFGWNGNAYILAEVGTQQVEYRYLARKTGKDLYEQKTMKAFDLLEEMQPSDGLLMQNINDGGSNGKPKFSNQKVSFGAMGDSVYEYMLKVWVQGGKKESKYRDMWDKAMDGMHEQLLQKSSPNGLSYIADRNGKSLDHKMDHLVCFMGGALALGAYTDPKGLDSPRAQRDLKTAKALTYTCYQMYARTKTGIAPEFVQFRGADDMVVPGSAPFYILRPETVEAFYYLSVLTGDPIYREWGWEVFQSIEKYCKTKYGYGSLKNVNNVNSVEDRMESFFLAETLKYLYLLFDPDSEIDILNKHVFNTEAHPVSTF